VKSSLLLKKDDDKFFASVMEGKNVISLYKKEIRDSQDVIEIETTKKTYHISAYLA
jgi:hypothetical protein